MMPTEGVRKILRFNWPWYAAAGGITVAVALLLGLGVVRGAAALVAAAGVVAADFWLLASLAVSHYVYDRSAVARGEWLNAVDRAAVRSGAIFHAGQDEASVSVAPRFPGVRFQHFDFFDPERQSTPSLQRARARAAGQVTERATSLADGRVPLADGALDLGLVAFAAHEIRQDPERTEFFRELARVLAPSGQVLVVEHLRDGWNFLAYGPGAFHFLSRRTWHRTFAAAGLKLARETPCTPFVRVFELTRDEE
jgi:SAM-dependent methyltransferase